MQPANAEAMPLRAIGLGMGADLTYVHSSAYKTAEQTSVTPELALQLDFLWALAIELNYKPAMPASRGELLFDTHLRLSGKIYIIPTSLFALYLKAGIAGMTFGDLFNPDSPGSAFHGGAGLEVYVTDSWAVAGEFLVLLPGVNRVAHAVQSYASDAQQQGGGFSSLSNPPQVGEFIGIRNFEAKLGFRFYL